MSNFAPDAHPVFTPEELYRICVDIKGMDIAEAMEYGREHGLLRCYIQSLRTLLGYAQPRGNRITDEGVEAIKADAAAGMTVAEIARKYNRSYYTMFAYIHNHGIETGNGGRFEWTEIKNRALVAYKMKGWTNEQIAAKIGTDAERVRSQLGHLKHHRPKRFEKVAEKMGFYKFLKEKKKNG